MKTLNNKVDFISALILFGCVAVAVGLSLQLLNIYFNVL